MTKPGLCLLALLALALPAAAGVGVWTPLGPDGGPVWALAVDPADPDVVYAGTWFGMFKSTDGGETWAASSRGLGPLGVHVRAILVRPEAVYIGTQQHGIFKSTDRGATWFPATSGIPPNPADAGPTAAALLADPRNPNRIWAGARRGLFSTTNGGATWTTRFKGDPFDNPVVGVAIDPVNGQIYISSSLRGVYTSTNQGKKWTKVSKGLLGSTYSDLVLDPRTPSILHVGTGTGLWRSDNRGGSWKRVAALGNRAVAALVYQGDRLIAAAATRGIFYSDDQGRTWTRASESPEGPGPIELATGPDRVYAGLSADGRPGGVYRSLDRGATWEASYRGLDSLPVQAVAVDPGNADVLYATVLAVGVFKSTDRGATWELLDLGADPPYHPQPGSLLVDPSDPSTVYGSGSFAGQSLLRSRDAGATWQQRHFNVTVSDLEVDPRAPGAIWAAGFSYARGSALAHSDDYGATWEPLPFPADVWIYAFKVDPTNPQVLWAAGYVLEPPQNNFHARVYRSADGGQTWHRRDSGLPQETNISVEDLAIDPADPNRLYAATLRGLYRTTDAGLTWTQVPAFPLGVTEVETSPTTPTTVYAHLHFFGILRSTDGGDTWSPARRGLAAIPLLDLLVDPTDPRRLYAGTFTRSVFTYSEP